MGIGLAVHEHTSPMFNLSPELRIRIYEEVLISNSPLELNPYLQDSLLPPALLQTCRRAYTFLLLTASAVWVPVLALLYPHAPHAYLPVDALSCMRRRVARELLLFNYGSNMHGGKLRLLPSCYVDELVTQFCKRQCDDGSPFTFGEVCTSHACHTTSNY